MSAELHPVRVVRCAEARACCARLERVELYVRGKGRGEAVYAMICPVHGPDGRGRARARPPAPASSVPARPRGIAAFKHQELPRRTGT